MKRLKVNIDKLKELNLENLIIESVEYHTNRNTLIIYIISKEKILKKEDKEKIYHFFKDLFNRLKVKMFFKYQFSNITNLEIINLYKNEILNYLSDNLESSQSWIKDLIIKMTGDSELTLYPPNSMASYMIKRNGLIKDLELKIFKELGIKLSIFIDESNIKENKNYLDKKAKEEKDLAKAVSKLKPKIKSSDENIKPSKNYKFGRKIKKEVVPIESIDLQTGSVSIEGEIFNLDSKEIRNNRTILTFNITDYTDSITVKSFLNKEKANEFLANIQDGMSVKLFGDVVYDDFSRGIVVMMKSLIPIEKKVREDKSKKKRVELHLHSKMSSMDGIVSITELIKRAELWGHKAVAITDHGVVQGFPEALKAEKDSDVKVIYGMEGYLVDDDKNIVTNLNEDVIENYNSFVIFDLETTGLSAKNDKITEIGAIKIRDGKVIDEYNQLINPERSIPEFITELTGISNDMVKDKPTIADIIEEFKDFIDGSVLVAHNAVFDIGFIRENLNKAGYKTLKNPILDTLELSRAVFPELKNHRLDTISKHLGVKLENHHRAVDDAKATWEIFEKILELIDFKEMKDIYNINKLNKNRNFIKDRPNHVVILAKNEVGLKNLYYLVSKSHMDYFYREPRIPKSLLEKKREGLLIGSACSSGELYQAILNNQSEDEIRGIVDFYDYLEIQPVDNNQYLLKNGIVKNKEELQEINKKIYEYGIENNKLVVATGDVHFLDPKDEVYRRILMDGQGFRDADNQAPLYFKTTDEMLEEFTYLGDDVAYEVVVENTNKINEMIDDIRPIPEGTFPPVIEGSEEELKEITYNRAYELYGDPLPEIVEKRLERELNSIIENNYSVMYIISEKLVSKSIEDGYLVGSRGSVGSSLVATMSGITEINPLVPHYLCPKCKYSKFFTDNSVASGADLEDANCPKCGTILKKDGHDIPFEVFLGFDGDKEPDIDLNFAGEYQAEAHRYTEEIFGEDHVFRAGTIGTIAERTAYGFVKKYFEKRDKRVNNAEVDRLVNGCTGIRRTSGQHPGGVMIVPHYKDILDFTPVQYPANDSSSGVITTHFDYNAISSNILKLDILGHDVPTIIKMLEDMTGVKSTDIPLDEPETMKLFSGTDSLGVNLDDINCKVGTLGIPEFGTRFVRQMLVDTKPTTFSELVRISGLSHGTDVWINNAQNLVREGIATLSQVISTREDIMLNLISYGMDKSKAFNIMEKVRKGRGLTEEEETEMRELGVKDWYIDSCKKIKYMFPKAHAAAYVMMSFRIAYYKVYHPEAFYATYFTTKAADFDADIVVGGKDNIKKHIDKLESLGYEATAKEKNLLTVLEVAYEMYKRGYKVEPVDLYNSDSDVFKLSKEGIIPPLKCLEGLGENAARNIVVERKKSDFISKEDLAIRSGVSKPAIEVLENHGCLKGLPDSNQLNLFNI